MYRGASLASGERNHSWIQERMVSRRVSCVAAAVYERLSKTSSFQSNRDTLRLLGRIYMYAAQVEEDAEDDSVLNG